MGLVMHYIRNHIINNTEKLATCTSKSYTSDLIYKGNRCGQLCSH